MRTSKTSNSSIFESALVAPGESSNADFIKAIDEFPKRSFSSSDERKGAAKLLLGTVLARFEAQHKSVFSPSQFDAETLTEDSERSLEWEELTTARIMLEKALTLTSKELFLIKDIDFGTLTEAYLGVLSGPPRPIETNLINDALVWDTNTELSADFRSWDADIRSKIVTDLKLLGLDKIIAGDDQAPGVGAGEIISTVFKNYGLASMDVSFVPMEKGNFARYKLLEDQIEINSNIEQVLSKFENVTYLVEMLFHEARHRVQTCISNGIAKIRRDGTFVTQKYLVDLDLAQELPKDAGAFCLSRILYGAHSPRTLNRGLYERDAAEFATDLLRRLSGREFKERSHEGNDELLRAAGLETRRIQLYRGVGSTNLTLPILGDDGHFEVAHDFLDRLPLPIDAEAQALEEETASSRVELRVEESLSVITAIFTSSSGDDRHLVLDAISKKLKEEKFLGTQELRYAIDSLNRVEPESAKEKRKLERLISTMEDRLAERKEKAREPDKKAATQLEPEEQLSKLARKLWFEGGKLNVSKTKQAIKEIAELIDQKEPKLFYTELLIEALDTLKIPIRSRNKEPAVQELAQMRSALRRELSQIAHERRNKMGVGDNGTGSKSEPFEEKQLEKLFSRKLGSETAKSYVVKGENLSDVSKELSEAFSKKDLKRLAGALVHGAERITDPFPGTAHLERYKIALLETRAGLKESFSVEEVKLLRKEINLQLRQLRKQL